MALDKLVDSSQLDADLLSVANAIRTKGGTSAALAFPAGFVGAIGDIPTGGGGGGVSGTFTPASNARSVTLTDCIGKKSIFIFPMFDITTAELTERAHWGALIVNGKCIMIGSTNSGNNGYTFNGILSSSSGQVNNPETFNTATGELNAGGTPGGNGGGYYFSGKTYGYIAW